MRGSLQACQEHTRQWRIRRGAQRRWRTAAVTAALGAVASLGVSACGGGTVTAATDTASSGLYGTLPPMGTPTNGGTVSFAQLTGDTPTYIFPIVPASQATTTNLYQFINNLFLPLYSSPVGERPQINTSLSLARLPVYSDHDTTVTIRLKPGFKWANGAPVDADDVIFTIDLTKAAVKLSAANFRRYTPGLFPDNVARATAVGKYTVVLHLTQPFNPGFFTDDELGIGDLTPLPSTAWNIAAAHGPHLDYTQPANATRIYHYLAGQGSKVSTFATNPLWRDVDGPFKLTSFTTANGSYTMAPNPSYGGSPKPRMATLRVETFTSATPILNALKTGSLDVAPLDFSQIGQAGALKSAGYSVFGMPAFGMTYAVLNFEDGTDHFNRVVSQLYVRQALQSLVDQPAMIKGILKGAGNADYGPIPTVPESPFLSGANRTAAYPYSLATAKRLLTQHGWKVVPNGTTTCAKPGAGAGRCGAGIPAGAPISFTWVYANLSPSVGLEAEAFASAATKVGIHVKVVEKGFDFLISTYNDVASPHTADQWGASDFTGITDPVYPTTNSVFNTGGSFNFGHFHDPRVDALVRASLHAADVDAVKRETNYIARAVPVLFLPNADYLYAVSKRVGGTNASFLSATQLVILPQFWYRVKTTS